MPTLIWNIEIKVPGVLVCIGPGDEPKSFEICDGILRAADKRNAIDISCASTN